MNTKSVFASKTVWLNLIAFLSLLIPTVQEWLSANPVEVGSVFIAVSVIVRFVTSGKVSLFGGDGGGVSVLLVVGLVGAGLGLSGSLSSCTPTHYVGDLSDAKYAERMASDASAVILDREDVRAVGQSFAPNISGTFRTDQGDFVVGPDGVSGDVVIDLRGKQVGLPVSAGK